ncbi:hypothetical protein D3C75_1145800 [compost metagenome]
MAQLPGTLAQRWSMGMLGSQGEQAVGQRRGRSQQDIPENHRKEALVGLPQQVALNPFEQR